MVSRIFSRVQKRWENSSFERKLLYLKLFYRRNYFRKTQAFLLTTLKRRKPLKLAHIVSYDDEDALGPVQRDEAIFLYGMIKTIRPKTVLEVGFSKGHSAFNFLKALDKNATIYSVDIANRPKKVSEILKKSDPRFHFIFKPQDELIPTDYDNRTVDFLFIDCSHDFELNKKTFLNISTSLAEDAVIVIHDTGIWKRHRMSKRQKEYIDTREDNRWLDNENCAHQPGERAFVNWIVENYPDYNSIHFHTTHVLRHGMTLLQKKRSLDLPEG